MRAAVRSKQDMYRRLLSGEFGNFNLHYTSFGQWLPHAAESPLWGLRSVKAGDNRHRLDVPSSLVYSYGVDGSGRLDGMLISPMLDHLLEFRAEVWQSPYGITAQGVTGHREVKWRDAFARFGRPYSLASAWAVLRHYLWPSDFDDLRELLDEYPGHVIEITACDRAVGTFPNRNTVVWEVRADDGSYEKWDHRWVT